VIAAAIAAERTAAAAGAIERPRGPLAALASFIDAESSAAKLLAIKASYGISSRGVVHLNEREALRPAGFPVINKLDALDFAELSKKFLELIFCSGVRQIPDVDAFHFSTLFS